MELTDAVRPGRREGEPVPCYQWETESVYPECRLALPRNMGTGPDGCLLDFHVPVGDGHYVYIEAAEGHQ